ncbi:MAG: hypothetical protein BJBARM4_0018 [Candidatus Parvarchaeum acidiphilum ARMAN-4]|jgi:hypothetical protein|uniref:Uncharacterized protein n=1 Tax=Candidatus Parvarchaeum acidiphilum ARMAN-4 TaxID=662760 RepID=D2EE86_PARA4|nr:MAG: hypothetical protein BJBARM4_0018 [Candidatus Parvarchaeum acidiphilum ARMAN-4]
MEFHLTAKIGKKGQLTMLDLVIAPLAAVILAIVAHSLLAGATASLLTSVSQQPTSFSCSFALDTFYSTYYVHSAFTLSQLALSDPSQYSLASSNQEQSLSTNCSGACNPNYGYTQDHLYNSTSLYSDFIGYFSGFSLNDFKIITGQETAALNALGMQVFFNQVPSGVSGTSECSLQVYNPADPSKPYTIYGVIK